MNLKNLMVLFLLFFLFGCRNCTEVSKTNIKATYLIGFYHPDPNQYNFRNYDSEKTIAFLNNLPLDQFEYNDIISVDNLKWRNESRRRDKFTWIPYPNPPLPKYDEKDKSHNNLNRYYKEYAKWIDDHPHFGFPPFPIDGKR